MIEARDTNDLVRRQKMLVVVGAHFAYPNVVSRIGSLRERDASSHLVYANAGHCLWRPPIGLGHRQVLAPIAAKQTPKSTCQKKQPSAFPDIRIH